MDFGLRYKHNSFMLLEPTLKGFQCLWARRGGNSSGLFNPFDEDVLGISLGLASVLIEVTKSTNAAYHKSRTIPE